MDPSGFDFTNEELWAQLSPQQQSPHQHTQRRRSHQAYEYSSDFSQDANYLYNATQQPGVNPYPLVSQGVGLNTDHIVDPRFRHQPQWTGSGPSNGLGMALGQGFPHSHSNGMMDASIQSQNMQSSQWTEGYVQYSNAPTHGTPYAGLPLGHHHSQQHQIPHYSGDFNTFPLVVPSSSSTDNTDAEWPRDSQSPSPTLFTTSLGHTLRNSSSSGSSANTLDGMLGGAGELEFSSVASRRAHVLEWMSKTALTPQQQAVAHVILASKWWELEDPEPEVRHNDELVKKGLIAHVGGSRFRAFLDEDNGYRCTFDHDGAPCTHGKGRTERALGTIRGFFRYKPVVCTGACGSRCNQRFVSVEQCQKHVQKKRSGRATCPDCGSSILPANMSRHRRACHVQEGTPTRPQ